MDADMVMRVDGRAGGGRHSAMHRAGYERVPGIRREGDSGMGDVFSECGARLDWYREMIRLKSGPSAPTLPIATLPAPLGPGPLSLFPRIAL